MNITTKQWADNKEGIEIDLERQVETFFQPTRYASTKVERSLAVAPLSAAFFSTIVVRNEGGEASNTDSESSDSSSDDENRRMHRLGDVSSKRRSKLPPSENLTQKKHTEKSENNVVENVEHFLLFAHGKLWTVVGIFFAWTGLVCAHQAKETTRFVTVASPIYVDATFNEVYDVGLINFKLCFNQTRTLMAGCAVHELEVSDINDKMFQLSRSMAFIATLLGGFLAACITVSIFWHSINLRPVGMGFLLAYFFQSFTFLFFDSQLCALHDCHVSDGAIYSVVASFCWIFACLASARMDAFKHRQNKEIVDNIVSRKKPSRFDRGISDITQGTEASYESRPSLGAVRADTKTNGSQLSLICGIEDRRAAKAWDARLAHAERPRGWEERRRQEQSFSSNRSQNHSPRRSRGKSKEAPVCTTRAMDLSREAPTGVGSPRTSAIAVHTASEEKKQTMHSMLQGVESPGRRAIRAHSSPKLSRFIDPRKFEL